MDRANILVIEDDYDSAEMLAEMLTMADYQVETASSADEVIAAMASRHYDLALLDLTLPGYSTNELIDKLLLVPGKPPLVIFSARPADDLRTAAQRLHAAGVLQKPARMAALLSTVARVVRGES